ncbi:hypothetical protein [Sphingomonas parva]|nr:hypothetical protein [Sphingomonas parva]
MDEELERRKRHYTDPMRGRLPELERCLVRHRALQMILIIYHAEELKRDVIGGVAAQKRWRRALSDDDDPLDSEEEVKGDKKLKRAFDHLVRDGVLLAAERQHMVKLIQRRNSIAHHLDQVTADLSTDRFVRDWVAYLPNRQSHDYEALDQLRAARRLLSERMSAKHYVREMDVRSILFEATERALSADIKSLDRRIRKLIRKRREDVARVNAELSLEGTGLTGVFDPEWPENRYDRGRLTPRGVETCYQLFDIGKSPMAVAHLMGLSLTSARRRRRMWEALGGPEREKRVLADIPKVRIRYRYED